MASKSSRLSRRGVLKAAGAAAVAGGASALLGGTGAAQQHAPAVLTNTQAGRKFKAFVKVDKGVPTVMQLTARALTGRQILVRTEAAQTCYSSVGEVLLPSATAPNQANIVGHGGVGVVEAIGPEVTGGPDGRAIEVGDRVVVNFHASCGWCHNCVWMRADKCLNATSANIPTCDTEDGKPVYSSRGGMADVMIVTSERATPAFTDLPAAELAMLHCVGNTGLGMSMTNCRVEAGSDVVIFGAGPVGLSAVQGARINGATRIIVVEPIPYRRELAMKLGATATVDPNQYKERVPNPKASGHLDDYFHDALVDHLRELCKFKTERRWAGGGRVGPDHIIEAVGGDYGGVKPKEVTGPDPTGVTVLQQCWELCSYIGTIVTCSIGHPVEARVQIPADQWTDGYKHHWPGTVGGTNTRRDGPRYIRMMESGQLNMKALASKVYPLSKTSEAYEEAMNRTVVATIVNPSA